MAVPHEILFLYAKRLVPEAVLAAARDRVPAGFSLTLCDETVDAQTRRARIGATEFVLLYGLPFDAAEGAKSVKLLQLLSAGYDRLDVEALNAVGTLVANNGGANAQTVAEHTLLLILAVHKRLPVHHNALAAGDWLGLTQALHLRELHNKQVGIVGFGHIGRLVARMVDGFGARPVFADPHVQGVAETPAAPMPFTELLATSDIVTLHAPLTAETRHLIGAAELAQMRRSAVLINTARGGVVDEGALITALQRGLIAGAGLDVFETEPVAPDNPLLAMPNVVVPPHVAGTTLDTWSRRLDFAFSNVVRAASGATPLSLVEIP